MRTIRMAIMLIGTILLGGGSLASAHPDLIDPQASSARVAVMKSFPGAVIRDWQPAPMPGLYMFTLNNDERIFFVDESGQYLLAQAALFDMKEQKNLTQEFIMGKRRELLAAVPLQDAILYRPSELAPGMRESAPVLVFDDPDCPFCRELHAEVKQLVEAGVPVAVFLHPVERLHKGAIQKSINIWCSDNRQDMLDTALAGKPVPDAGKPCDAPLEHNLQLARQLGGGPTPYIVFPDGRTVAGKKSVAELMAMLGMPPTVAQQLGSVSR
ncbi:MAG: DsbC family protein (plasmid) [Nitrospira sp.]